MKRVIITGATGCIGTALIQEFINNNIEVLVFCRENSKRNVKIPQHKLVTIKYCSLDQLSTIQNDTCKEYDAFYHFAWDGTINPYRNDVYLQTLNVKYALDAVGCAKRFGCKVFVGAGSQAEYGRVEGIITRDTPVKPDNGYGIGKLCAGQMTREYAHQLGLKHIWTRVLSVYGINDGDNSLVMSTIYKLMNHDETHFTKGEQLWDFLYNKDAASAFRLIGNCGIDGKTYVVGKGEAHPLSYYIYIIRDIVAPEMDLILGDMPYSDRQVMHLEADISELVRDTGWKPRYSFENGIQEIVDNYKM